MKAVALYVSKCIGCLCLHVSVISKMHLCYSKCAVDTVSALTVGD